MTDRIVGTCTGRYWLATRPSPDHLLGRIIGTAVRERAGPEPPDLTALRAGYLMPRRRCRGLTCR